MKEPTWGHTREGLPVHAHTRDHLPHDTWYKHINSKIAIWITVAVGSMTCAWLFAILAIAGLPTALKPGNIGLLFWISSDFLQLTLLSVIIVGQNIQAKAADARANKTFEDTEIIVDRLDYHTEGGIKEILNAIDALEAKLPKRRVTK